MFLTNLVLSATAISVVAANPIEPRGGTGTSIFGTYFASLIKGAIEGKGTVCDEDMQEGDKYNYSMLYQQFSLLSLEKPLVSWLLISIIVEGDDGNGNKFTACWMDGVDPWDQATADTANCLTNLHFVSRLPTPGGTF